MAAVVLAVPKVLSGPDADQQFLDAEQEAGITFDGPMSYWIAKAHDDCERLADGQITVPALISEINGAAAGVGRSAVGGKPLWRY